MKALLELAQSYAVDSTNICRKVLWSDETKTDLSGLMTKCYIRR